MAGGGGIGSGGKRNVNADLNLVPYIDLLSTLICFLLITAVWQQINSVSTKGQNSTSSENPLPQPETEKIDLSISIYQDHIEASAGPDKHNIPITLDLGFDSNSLLQIINGWKTRWPQKNDVIIHSDSESPYKYLIKVMDLLIEGQFQDIGVNTH